MRKKTYLLAGTAGLACCILLAWLSTCSRGVEKTYEIESQIWTPEYRTDTTRAIDAYERLMHRYMDMTEQNLLGIGSEIRTLANKLDSIDARLSDIGIRIARIEIALGIEPPESRPDDVPQHQHSDEENGPEPAQPM